MDGILGRHAERDGILLPPDCRSPIINMERREPYFRHSLKEAALYES